MKYKRILLKLSGESLQGKQHYGLSPEVLQSYAEQIGAAFRRQGREAPKGASLPLFFCLGALGFYLTGSR